MVGSGVLIHYKNDHTGCLIKNSLMKKEEKYWESEDTLLTWLRRLDSLAFAISISYFIFFQRSKTLLAVNSVFYQLFLIIMTLSSLIVLNEARSSKCKDTNVGKAVAFLGLIFLISSVTIMVLHAILLCWYKKYNSLPEWLVGQKVPKPRGRKDGDSAQQLQEKVVDTLENRADRYKLEDPNEMNEGSEPNTRRKML